MDLTKNSVLQLLAAEGHKFNFANFDGKSWLIYNGHTVIFSDKVTFDGKPIKDDFKTIRRALST